MAKKRTAEARVISNTGLRRVYGGAKSQLAASQDPEALRKQLLDLTNSLNQIRQNQPEPALRPVAAPADKFQ